MVTATMVTALKLGSLIVQSWMQRSRVGRSSSWSHYSVGQRGRSSSGEDDLENELGNWEMRGRFRRGRSGGRAAFRAITVMARVHNSIAFATALVVFSDLWNMKLSLSRSPSLLRGSCEVASRLVREIGDSGML